MQIPLPAVALMAGVRTTGLEQHLRNQKAIKKRAENLKPAMIAGLTYMTTNAIPARFDRGISHRGVRWQRPTAKTLKRKKGRGRTLVESGIMQSSVQAGTVSKAGKRFVAIGTNIKYAATHQNGDPSRNIPKREFVGFSKRDVKILGEITVKFIVKGKR